MASQTSEAPELVDLPSLVEAPVSAKQPCRMRHAPGDVLSGRYILRELIGRGGMGSVWRAHCTVLDIDVAVKLVSRGATSEDDCERLRREAQSAARIEHQSIVRVHDFGRTEQDEPYLVMELLNGSSLGDWLDQQGHLPPALAVQMVLPVVSALAATHALGIIHRDIKPENIVVVHGDAGSLIPKIVDFGIVKLTMEGRRVLTRAGVLVGSPEYMSPEQITGTGDVDGTTDAWALCVVLYELLTGRRPFEASTMQALFFSILRADPTPIAIHDAGDEALWAILQRGLAKDPAERWSGMTALGRALAEWALDQGIETDVTGTSIATRWLPSSTRVSLHGVRLTPDSVRSARVTTPLGTADTQHALEPESVTQLGDKGRRALSRIRRAPRLASAVGLAAVLAMIGWITLGSASTAPAAAAAETPIQSVPATEIPAVTPWFAHEVAPEIDAPEPPVAPKLVATPPSPRKLTSPQAVTQHRSPSAPMPLPAQPDF